VLGERDGLGEADGLCEAETLGLWLGEVDGLAVYSAAPKLNKLALPEL